VDKALLARVEKQSWHQRYPRGLPVFLFLLTSGVTAVSVYSIELAEHDRRQTELERSATEIGSAIERRAAANAAYLRAGSALMAMAPAQSGPMFEAFVKQLHHDGNYRGAHGMGWAPRIERAQIPALEAAMHAEGNRGFRVWPQSTDTAPLLFPITYLYPADPSNLRAIGFNMYGEAVRRAAMAEAARRNRPITSGRVVLVQENGEKKQAGFLVYNPVETGGTLKGFVYSPFRAQDFLNSANELHRVTDVGIRLYDQRVSPDTLLAETPIKGETGDSFEKPLTVGTRDWVLRVDAPATQSLSMLSRVTLLFGLTVAFLLLTIARFVTKRGEDDRRVLDWLTQQAAIRTSLTRELNHRVKNTLANVLSIVALTRRRATGLDDYVEKLTGRVRALSATHDLLTRSEWGHTQLRDVIEAEVAPYTELDDRHVMLDGPEINLAPNDALSLGLAIHELATNASKYGALSAPTGMVRISWSLDEPGVAQVHWQEEGGPVVTPPTTRGFGRDLIEKIVSHELKSPVDLRFDPAGVECTLHVPVRVQGQFTLRTQHGSGERTA